MDGNIWDFLKCISEKSQNFGKWRKLSQFVYFLTSITLVTLLSQEFFKTIIPAFQYYQKYSPRNCDKGYYFSNQELSEEQIISENCVQQLHSDYYSQDTQSKFEIGFKVFFGVTFAILSIQAIMAGVRLLFSYKCESKVLDCTFVIGDFCSSMIIIEGIYTSVYDPSDKCIKQKQWDSLQTFGIVGFIITFLLLIVYYLILIMNLCCVCCQCLISKNNKIIILNLFILAYLVEVSLATKNLQEMLAIQIPQWVQIGLLAATCFLQFLEGVIEYKKVN